MTLLLPLIAFLLASTAVGAVALVVARAGASPLERRLSEVTGVAVASAGGRRGVERAAATLKRFSRFAPAASAKEAGALRRRLVQAGYRGHEALALFFGIRLGVALACFAVFASPVFFRPNVLVALGACGFGYVIPGVVLARIAKRRQHRIRLGLPDVLDLLVVSVEAGLGLDQALQRVGDELAFAHPDLSDELRLINLELRAGKARVDALRNLADRTGVDDIASLVAMLVQTDKFGTSVAQSLRIHSDTVRTKRRQRAEEAAAKTGVKMVFPLVFCIFPAVWVVTIGPAAIKFVQVLLPITQK